MTRSWRNNILIFWSVSEMTLGNCLTCLSMKWIAITCQKPQLTVHILDTRQSPDTVKTVEIESFEPLIMDLNVIWMCSAHFTQSIRYFIASGVTQYFNDSNCNLRKRQSKGRIAKTGWSFVTNYWIIWILQRTDKRLSNNWSLKWRESIEVWREKMRF